MESYLLLKWILFQYMTRETEYERERETGRKGGREESSGQ
jgi:hypothetical protein